ncbi:hypothetical protein C7M84_024762 [Penaeus vannamei]|uniref:Uncharacterized protein n=1 Tax=Penaeus vannamei TaxID=6689 RepID=A0A423U042_PENVA|nr:hypothetical protein C7M84_024762 [Penaeus vannamei]
MEEGSGAHTRTRIYIFRANPPPWHTSPPVPRVLPVPPRSLAALAGIRFHLFRVRTSSGLESGAEYRRAYRGVAGGCLNYGHSCLGAHGKRSSSNPGEGRSITPTLQPALPRPLLDILLDALSSATRPGAQSAAHSQFRQRIPSDFAAANAATRALLLEDVNEAGARAMADGNEDSGSFAYAPNGQETEDAVFVFSPVEDYSEARYRRDAGNASAKDVVFAKDETLPKDSELEEKEGEDVALEVTRDGKRRMSTRAAQPRRIVDLHILAVRIE